MPTEKVLGTSTKRCWFECYLKVCDEKKNRPELDNGSNRIYISPSRIRELKRISIDVQKWKLLGFWVDTAVVFGLLSTVSVAMDVIKPLSLASFEE